MNLKKSIIKVFSANLVQLVTSIVVTFFVPLIVSIDNYSQIKTYTLYIGYVAIFSLGFYDGIYLKYGGKERQELESITIVSEHTAFILIQLLFTVIWLFLGFVLKNTIIIFFALTIWPANMLTYYKRLYLAIGEYSVYKNGMIIYSFCYMIFNCLLALVLKINAAVPYYMCSIVANVVSVIYNIVLFNRNFKSKVRLSISVVKSNIMSGWLILIGNLVVNAIYSIDRWFVKLGFNSDEFAFYSFAVSMLNIVMVLVQAVALALYNYLAKEKSIDKIKNVKALLLVIGTLASAGYYVLYYIIRLFLNNYIPSLDIIAVSFAAYPYMIVINSLYLNLYKTDKTDKDYIKSVIFMIIISIVLNCIVIIVSTSILPIAFATTVSFIIWYIYCEKDFGMDFGTKHEIVYLIVMMLAFFFLGLISSKIVSCVFYLLLWMFCTTFYLKTNKISLFAMINKKDRITDTNENSK